MTCKHGYGEGEDRCPACIEERIGEPVSNLQFFVIMLVIIIPSLFTLAFITL